MPARKMRAGRGHLRVRRGCARRCMRSTDPNRTHNNHPQPGSDRMWPPARDGAGRPTRTLQAVQIVANLMLDKVMTTLATGDPSAKKPPSGVINTVRRARGHATARCRTDVAAAKVLEGHPPRAVEQLHEVCRFAGPCHEGGRARAAGASSEVLLLNENRIGLAQIAGQL